jgi:long-chain-fatty-acid---luciferin-component ligase
MDATKELKELNKPLKKFLTPEESWNPVERALFTPDSFFSNYEKNQKLLYQAIKYSYKHHFENNSIYHKLCEINKITPNDINSIDDIKKIPLLPDTFFKDYPEGKGFLKWIENIYTGIPPKPEFDKEVPSHDNVIHEFNKKDIRIMFTSGTSGRFSFIPRDTDSWNLLKYNAIKSFIELMDYNPKDTVILLIPDPRLTNLTIASLFGIAFDLYNSENIHIALKNTKITTQFLRMQRADTIGIREKIKARAMSKISPIVQKKSDLKIINILKEKEKEGKRVVIAGPPFWLDRIMEQMKKEEKTVNLTDSQVLTGGGWKAEEDKRTPEERFREKVQEVLGIPHERYHDVYAMSECSSVFLSCEGHYKHVPPTIIPLVFNEELNQIEYNEFGRFAFIDPIPKSYPGFLITGDKVKLLRHCPVCNREGPVLDIEVNRMPGSEGRGCAAVMADLMNKEE